MPIAEDQLQAIALARNSITRRRKAQHSLLEQKGRSKKQDLPFVAFLKKSAPEENKNP
jgi:hypothetical protein